MAPSIIRTGLLAAACCLMICLPQYAGSESEEAFASLNKQERARINCFLKLETETDISSLLSQPVERLQEKILKSIKEKQGIEIKRSSMIKTDQCLYELLSGMAHLAKISSGHKIERVVIKLTGATSRASIWSKWEVRKLESPHLTITFYYDDPDLEPSEIYCHGHKYH